MDSLTQDLADLIPVSEKLKKENDEFKLEIESLKQTIEEGENERIQMLRNDILFFISKFRFFGEWNIHRIQLVSI